MTENKQLGESQHELDHVVHSTTSLVKAGVFASLLAIVVLISAILPAEYGIDPFGIGKAIGFTQLSSEAVIDQTTELEKEDLMFREDSRVVNVPAGKGLEYKFYLTKGNTLRYAWESPGHELFFDFHGEPEGDTTGYFESYTVSTSSKVRGSLTASFNGSHGWYWRNDNLTAVDVTLNTEGSYEIIGTK